MLSYDDHLAVAVSGGKDSLSLLHILAKQKRFRPKTSLTAVTVDEGIAGYRNEALEIAAANCKKLEIPHHVVSFKELYGFTLDEIILEPEVKETGLTACAYCGVLRRKAINIGARQFHEKVATAHTLDDEAQTILMNIFHGDVARLAKEKPVTGEVRPFLCKKLSRSVKFRERKRPVRLRQKNQFPRHALPLCIRGIRNDIRFMLNRWKRNMQEQNSPSSKL